MDDDSKSLDKKCLEITKHPSIPAAAAVAVGGVVVVVVVVVVGCVASAVLKTHDSQATIFGSRCFSSNHYICMIFRLVSDFRGGF